MSIQFLMQLSPLTKATVVARIDLFYILMYDVYELRIFSDKTRKSFVMKREESEFRFCYLPLNYYWTSEWFSFKMLLSICFWNNFLQEQYLYKPIIKNNAHTNICIHMNICVLYLIWMCIFVWVCLLIRKVYICVYVMYITAA